MGYDPNVCLQKIKDKGRIACDSLNLPYHCDTLTGVGGDYHDECVDAGIIYFQVKVATCWNSVTNQNKYFPPATYFKECDALHQADPAWQQRWCYCCCACFAKDTLVAVPGGYAEMYTIPNGAKVLTRGVTNPDWSESIVKFSMGTGEGAQPFMVYIGFEDSVVRDLICTQEQPFLLANGKFTTANKLTPGMQLVDKNGAPVEIKFVSLGTYNGGVHHIATDNPWSGTPDGHLILAGGVVAGDFEMQVKFGELHASLKHDVDNVHAVIGTEAYEIALRAENAQTQLSSTHFEFRYKKNKDGAEAPKALGNGAFKTYTRVASILPIGAQSLFTEDQAKEILANCKQVPLSDPTPKYFYDTAQIQLNGYFPDIVFYLDVFDMLPNVYAFEAYGKKIVQVSGGLARLVDFNFEGLLMAMAHGVGCFYGGEPKVLFGYTAIGQADRYAFGNITGKLWLGDPAFGYINAAIQQWTMLFGYIKDHRGGSDPITDPSISCRLEVIQSAPFGGGLPPCAGGTPPKLIDLQVAQAPNLDSVELIFNLPINPATADDVSNYTFVPEVKVLEAVRSSEKDFAVELTVKLEAGVSYKVTVKNLKSSLGTGMDPAHSQAEFQAP